MTVVRPFDDSICALAHGRTITATLARWGLSGTTPAFFARLNA
jgi:hypothetical protein